MDLAAASVHDYRELARRRLPRQLFDYIDGGAYDEHTLRINVDDLRAISLRQRVLQDVSDLNSEVEVLGETWPMPVALGPVGLAGMFARRGEVQAARAAAAAGVRFCASTLSICSIEEIASAADSPVWFQLYVMKDRAYAAELMARAAAVGCRVLVLTVDLAAVGARYRDTRNGMTGEVGLRAKARRAWDLISHPNWLVDVGLGGKPHTFGNLERAVPGASSPAEFRAWVDAQFDRSVNWSDLAWVREHWKGKLVLKGILDPDDAHQAAEEGVDGIIVSNHGGRQLDGVSSTAHALPEIVQRAGARLEVLVDGGIHSGLDVLKMLALGADACLLGRAWALPLAARGGAGVEHALEIIARELHVAMALTATRSLEQVSAEILDVPSTRR
jgi:L-lactate dehydrogenase (cytochrome)